MKEVLPFHAGTSCTTEDTQLFIIVYLNLELSTISYCKARGSCSKLLINHIVLMETAVEFLKDGKRCTLPMCVCIGRIQSMCVHAYGCDWTAQIIKKTEYYKLVVSKFYFCCLGEQWSGCKMSSFVWLWGDDADSWIPVFLRFLSPVLVFYSLLPGSFCSWLCVTWEHLPWEFKSYLALVPESLYLFSQYLWCWFSL